MTFIILKSPFAYLLNMVKIVKHLLRYQKVNDFDYEYVASEMRDLQSLLR